MPKCVICGKSENRKGKPLTEIALSNHMRDSHRNEWEACQETPNEKKGEEDVRKTET